MKTIEEALNHYIGHIGGTPRSRLDAELGEHPGRTPMAAILLRFQKQAGAVAKLNPNAFVLFEDDVTELLNFLGYKVNFGE